MDDFMDKKHILMIDDVSTNLKCAAEVLKDNYRFSMEKSGEQALRFLSRIKPDLILLDINMPNMNGYEFMEKKKENSQWDEIPVIFLTSDIEIESEIKSYKAGAVDYIRKPFEPEVMIEKIEKSLKKIEYDNVKVTKSRAIGLWKNELFIQRVNECLKENLFGYFILISLHEFRNSIENDMNGKIKEKDFFFEIQKMASELSENEWIGQMDTGNYAIYCVDNRASNLIQSVNLKDLKKIIDMMKEKFIPSRYRSGWSMGVAVTPNHGKSYEDVYKNADKALYLALNETFNNFQIYGMKSTQFPDEMNIDHYIKNFQKVDRITFYRMVDLLQRCEERGVKYGILSFWFDDVDDRKIECMTFLEDCLTKYMRKGDIYTLHKGHILTLMLNVTETDMEEIGYRILSEFKEEEFSLCELKYRIEKDEILNK